MNWTKYLPCLLILGMGSGCSSEVKHPGENQDLCLTDSLLKIVSVDTVHLHDVADELTLNGRVTFNQEQVAHVYPMFGGTVTELRAEVGDYVRKGDILAILRSGEVADYERQMKEAEQLINAEAEEDRIKETFSINNFSGRSFYEVKSPVSGFIVEKSVSRNMQLRPDQGEEIFTVSGLEHVWVMADVYDSDISKVAEGASVHITTLAYPGKVFSGNIDKVYHMLNTESKTMNVRVKLCNEDYLLKPGMFTTVNVECKSSGKQMPRIDAHALIFEGGKNYVVTVTPDNRLKVKEVDVYKRQNQECYVRSGLSEGDRVLNQNVLLVYNNLNAD